MNHLMEHIKIWTVVGGAQLVSVTLEQVHTIFSIIALACGAIASLAIAYYYIRKHK